MSATVLEAGTQPGTDYLHSIFADLPTDTRFTQTKYVKYTPKTGTNYAQIDFELEKREPPMVYLFGDIMMEVNCRIVTPTGELPKPTALVTLANNSLHSLFHTIYLRINNSETS